MSQQKAKQHETTETHLLQNLFTNIESMTTPTDVITESRTTPPVTSSETYISSEASIPSMQSSNVESMTVPTVETTNSTPVIKDASTTGGITHTVETETEITITKKSEVTQITTNENTKWQHNKRINSWISNSTEKNNPQTTTETVTYTSKEPVFDSLGWTSTQQNFTVTKSFTPISPDSDSSQKTPSTEIEQTTYTNLTVSVEKSSPNRSRHIKEKEIVVRFLQEPMKTVVEYTK
ncbi:unnamed protein product [Mytilus coruscus]|uniref:Uncharacterized protein n=1 Tax=Mytilus coruscus TaxID=42192 RepID=A0A6J8EAB3_MYTCO|nr:unnamed protein product [Mytilus coruscus]